ncbi:hypothetical protein QBC47DRAFT_437273 [Echria macrotheca]|uniref:SH3 domain-containing protein n=1 Tax=Echria macrotheca TaxID=438768 RepID=A0AAJ0BMB3_9PEZI|nr:hypothetical protein QBC47DRAFT_437273 [Echria macrotheca]
MEDIRNLVLSPFHDTVAKAKKAVENATTKNDQAMVKAAQSLVTNGERAVKRLEPVCQRGWDEYGVAFVDALKENDEISSFREKMHEMLWDLDDCIEGDTFDPQVFTQLQGIIRTAALRTSDIIVRMRLTPRVPGSVTDGSQADDRQSEPPSRPSINPWAESLPDNFSEEASERRPRVDLGDDNDPGQPRADSPTLERTLPLRIRPRTPSHRQELIESQAASYRGSNSDGHASRYSQASTSSPHTRNSVISPVTEEPYASPITPHSRPESFNHQWPVGARIQQPGLELAPPFHLDDGLIPVPPAYEERDGQGIETVSSSSAQGVDKSCTITPDSSFHRLKGFCDGATEVLRGNLGVKKMRQQTGGLLGMGVTTTARCKHCMFELDWGLVEADLERDPRATYKTAGVGFRMRFLSKSHLPAKRGVDDELYACVFCVQTGVTTHMADATVFFSQKQLFAHLARHPRPLPPVAGMVVIEAPDVPPEHANAFDLHFSGPPAPRSSMAEMTAEQLNRAPTAVATQTFRELNGSLRLPPDRAATVQFAAGARIVGIEFPVRYQGEWAVGWADHVRAVFPMDHVKLVVPPEAENHLSAADQVAGGHHGGSSRTGVARWKRRGGDSKDGWLKFDKGEAITGITFSSQDHWCWAGYNQRGKWGFFPQAFLEPSSIVDNSGPASPTSPVAGGNVSLHSIEGVRGGEGLFSRFSRRRRDSRRTGSGTARPMSRPGPLPEDGPGPSIY